MKGLCIEFEVGLRTVRTVLEWDVALMIGAVCFIHPMHDRVSICGM